MPAAHFMSVSCSACSHAYADTALFCPNCGRPKARSAAADVLVGSVLGERFQVQALMGQGASGTIYRAEHTTLKRRVAIKVLHAELSRDDLAVERFRREATTVADIDNEHIVEIHDFGRTPDGRLYLAMELLEGETLDAVLAREKQLSVERAADILIQAGEALAEAHAIGYVHRDLRPHNLMITHRRGKANFVKLLDFGLAKLVEADSAVASTNLGMTFGDPRYMSPEQARGERIDRRADIYQLGCVAYEMLTGSPPFVGSRVFEILTKQVSEAPKPLPTMRPGVPLWMEAAVTKMLAKDPGNRFATTTRLVDALRRGLDTGEVMEDAVARRRESVPPASVSRVMAKFGVTDQSAPVVTIPAAALESGPTPAPPAMPDSVELLRKRTGTPKVGVPAYNESEPAKSASVSRPTKDDDGWYDEDPGSSRAGMSYDDLDKPATNRRWGLIAVVLGTLLLVGGGAFALTRGGDEPVTEQPKQEPVAAPALTVDAAPASIIEAGSGSAQVVTAPPPPTNPTTPTKKPATGPRNPSTASNTRPPPGPRVPASTPGSGFPFPVLGSDDPPTQPLPPTTPPTTPTTNPPVVSPPINTPTTPYDTGDPDGGDEPSVNGDPEDPYGGGGSGNSSRVAPPTTLPAITTATPADSLASTGARLLADGDTSGAASSFKQALEADPGNFTARVGMGEIALRQGLFGDAIAHLKKATKLSPRSARAFTLLGEAYLNSGNNAAAETAFKKALQLDPDNARARDGFNDATAG